MGEESVATLTEVVSMGTCHGRGLSSTVADQYNQTGRGFNTVDGGVAVTLTNRGHVVRARAKEGSEESRKTGEEQRRRAREQSRGPNSRVQLR